MVIFSNCSSVPKSDVNSIFKMLFLNIVFFEIQLLFSIVDRIIQGILGFNLL